MGSRSRRRKNGAGLGAFLGSLVGVIAGGVIWPPLGVLGSIAGGALGGVAGAKADRRKRGGVGGAVGGALLGPIGAAVGGYVGGRKPDAEFSGKAKKNPRQYDPEEWVEFVLEGMAERDAKVTAELRAAADEFELAIDDALDVCLDKFPPAVDPARLYGDPATALDIFMTLSGEGVGIWDGRWDLYYPDAKPRHWNRLQSCLRSELKKPYHRLESALIDAAYVINDNPTRRLSKRLAKKVKV